MPKTTTAAPRKAKIDARSPINPIDRDHRAERLRELVKPFGWTIRNAELTEAEALAVDELLENCHARQLTPTIKDVDVPDAFWQLVGIPDHTPPFSRVNDAKALACLLLETGRDVTWWATYGPDDGGDDLKQSLWEIRAEAVTPFGDCFTDIADNGDVSIWFGRRAGQLPAFSGADSLAAVRVLFNLKPPAGSSPNTSVRANPEVPDASEFAYESGKKTAKAAKKKAAASTPDKASTSRSARATEEVPVASIDVTHNARTEFDDDELAKLTKSIQQFGILQPLLVKAGAEAGRYNLIAGERRLRAAKLAGLDVVPVSIVAADDQRTALMALEENLKRVDLNPIDRANELRRLMTDHGMTQAQVGAFVGVTQGQVSNELRLLNLPANWQAKVSSGDLAPTLVRQLLPYADLPQVLEAIAKDLDQFKSDLSENEPITADVLTQMIEGAVLKTSRPMKLGIDPPAYHKPTPKERHFSDELVTKDVAKQLAPRKFEFLHEWQGQERTFAVKLWEQLNAEPFAQRMEKHKAYKKRQAALNGKDETPSKTEPIKQYGEYRLKDAIESTINKLFVAAMAASKDTTAVERVCLSLALSGELADLFGGIHKAEFYGNIVAQMESSDKKNWLTDIRVATLAHYNKKPTRLPTTFAISLGEMLGIDVVAQWTPSAAVFAELTESGLAICQRLAIPDDTNELKGEKLIKALIARWPAGLIPPFLRYMFGLPKAAASKVKKSRAA